MVTPRRSGAWQRRDSNNHPEDGFVLPTVLGVGLILLVSSLALGYSAYQANLGGIQNLQAAQAEANAETGAAQIFNALNNQYFFLTRVSQNKWTSTYQTYKNISTTKNCDGFTLPSDPLLTENPLSGSGKKWQLIDYQPHIDTSINNNSYASMIVEGWSTIGNARTRVQYTYTLKAAPPNGELGFPGLLARTITLGENDILGVTINGKNSCSGNILCTDCQSLADLKQGTQSIVDGIISIGPITWPSVPQPPSQVLNLGSITKSTIGDLNKPNDPTSKKSDTLDLPRVGDRPSSSDGNFHYTVSSIDLNGQETININTTEAKSDPPVASCLNTYPSSNPSDCHQVIIHLTGDLAMSGQASFNHTGDPEDFIIYGNAVGGATQSIKLNGGSTASKIFVYAPTATIGIYGGSSTPDFYGAVWGNSWNGSNSNNAEITVPWDMYQRIRTLKLSPPPSNDFRLQSSSSWERGK